MYKDAEEYFISVLCSTEGKRASDYAKKREIDESTLREFGIGAAPDYRKGHTIVEYLLNRGYGRSEIQQSGLARGGDIHTLEPTFTGRLMFPIKNEKGKIVAFAGRDLQTNKDKRPKYLNTAFEKGSTLYGLDSAVKSGMKDIVVCEGYMDVIAMHRAGHKGAVALMGTALTDKQIEYLKGFRNIIFCLDGDDPGQLNAKKNLEHLYSLGLRNIYNIKLPDGHDPDELLRMGGKKLLDSNLKPKTLVHAEIDRLADKYAGNAAKTRDNILRDNSIEAVEKGISYIADHPDRIKADIGYLAQKTGFPENILTQELDRIRGQKAKEK